MYNNRSLLSYRWLYCEKAIISWVYNSPRACSIKPKTKAITIVWAVYDLI